MANESPRLAFCTVSCLALLLLPLLYAVLFQSDISSVDLWEHRLAGWGERFVVSSRDVDGGTGIIEEEDPLKFYLRRLLQTGRNRVELDSIGFSCDSDLHSDVCVANQPVKIDLRTLTVHLESSNQILPNLRHTIRPYAKKGDENSMKQVTPVEIRTPNSYSPPRCDITHEVPAAIFSSGGLTGNLFHEFNEIIIPLFITCRHFRSRIRFIITDFKPWWVRKFGPYLSKLSWYGIINSGKDDRVHCFPGAVIGLKYHDNLSCNTSSIPGGYSMLDFKRFLRESFNLKTKHEFEIEKLNLILISRRNSIKFLNEGDMVRAAKELGFRVTVISPGRKSNLQKMSELVNSCSVLVGAHGTGLTNAVFLPAGAVLVQVVPWGLDRPSNAHFGGPVRQMGLHYIEYRISPDESTLVKIYGRDHPVITDSASLYGQDLRLKIDRFKETLEHALYLLGRLSPN